MPLVTLLIVLICIGVLLWAITSFIPRIKRLIQIVGMIVAVVYVLSAFGLFGNIGALRGPSAR